MNEGIEALLTPVPIPRHHSKPESATGCAGYYSDPGIVHVFMDRDDRLGHKICENEANDQPASGRVCIGRKAIKGERFIDLRDGSEPRQNPKNPPADSPYPTVRNFVSSHLPPDIRDGVLTAGSCDLDALVLGFLLMDPQLAAEILVDIPPGILPARSVDGVLRTKTMYFGDTGKKEIICEAIIQNLKTLHEVLP